MKEQYQEKLKEFGQEKFKEMADEYFARFPFVQAVRWTQYTPYFNDGDPCEFGANQPEIAFTQEMVNANHEALDLEEDFDELQWVGYVYEKHKDPNNVKGKVADALSEAETFIEFEDVLETTFGDGVEVTIDREGITVEEYSHD